MDQVTQQNAAMVEQTSAASHTLRQGVAELTGSIGRFQVGEPPRAGGRASERRRTAASGRAA